MAREDLDLAVVARYAFLISLTHLIPVPIVDAWIAGMLRNRLTRVQLDGAGWRPPPRDVRMLASANAGGCLGMLWSLITWPIKKLIRFFLWIFLVKAMVDTFSAVVARAVLIDESLATGLLPGDAVRARAAMQRAARGIDTRPIDRAVLLIFQTTRAEMWRWLKLARSRMRVEARRERSHANITEDDRDPLHASLESLILTLAQAVWVPEVHDDLRAALRREVLSLPRPEEVPDGPPKTPDRT
jgi:hypothetical protein